MAIFDVVWSSDFSNFKKMSGNAFSLGNQDEHKISASVADNSGVSLAESGVLHGKMKSSGMATLLDKSPRHQQIAQLQRKVDASDRQRSSGWNQQANLSEKGSQTACTSYCEPFPMQLAKIGVELTFTDNDIANLSPDKRLAEMSPEQRQQEIDARNAAARKMDAWAGRVNGYGTDQLPPGFKKGKGVVKDNYKARYEQMSKSKAEQFPRAKLVEYTWMENKVQRGFWWNMDLDPGVLEVQAQPIDTAELADGEPVAAIMDDDIFGGAAHAGLEARSELGGGHVNVDLESGFGSYKNVLRTFLLAAFEQQYKDLDPGHDMLNNPSLVEDSRYQHGTYYSWLPVLNRARYDQLAAIIRRGINSDKQQLSKDDMKGIIRQLAVWFRENRTTAQGRRDGQNHFQAINVDHTVHNANKKHENRVEFRNPDAQTSRADLLADVGVITTMIEKAKRMDQATVDGLLTQLENQYRHWRPAALQAPADG